MTVALPCWKRVIATALLVVATGAQAQTGELDSGGTAWLMIAGLLALIGGVPGLALLYAGSSVPRHALAITGQAALISAVGSLVWLVAGYSLAYAPGSPWVGGSANFLMANLGFIGESAAIPEAAFVFVSLSSAVVAGIIATSVIADRVRLGWLLPFSALWSLVVLAPVTHWLSADGWLTLAGAVDFGGGLTIHLVAGMSALVLVLLCGAPADGAPDGGLRFSPLLALSGVALAWAGLLASIGGASAGSVDDGSSALLMAHATGVSALLTWAGLDRLAHGKASASGLAKGAMAGLAVAASLAGTVGLAGALIAGVSGAVLCRSAEAALPARLRAADPLSIVAIHAVGGAVGALLLAPLALPALGGPGWTDGTGIAGAFLAQLTGVAAVGGYAAAASLCLGLSLTILVPVRASLQAEADGLSLAHHGENG